MRGLRLWSRVSQALEEGVALQQEQQVNIYLNKYVSRYMYFIFMYLYQYCGFGKYELFCYVLVVKAQSQEEGWKKA